MGGVFKKTSHLVHAIHPLPGFQGPEEASQSCEDDLGPGSSECAGASFTFKSSNQQGLVRPQIIYVQLQISVSQAFKSNHTTLSDPTDRQTGPEPLTASPGDGSLGAWMRFLARFYFPVTGGRGRLLFFEFVSFLQSSFECPKFNMQELAGG